MKNYSELPDINTQIPIDIIISPIGNPCIKVNINEAQFNYTPIKSTVRITEYCKLLDTIKIEITLLDKLYHVDSIPAVQIQINIDNIGIIPEYSYLANYKNDHNFTDPTNYLGFNGKWALTIDRPFYHWLHQVQGQGWLLS